MNYLPIIIYILSALSLIGLILLFTWVIRRSTPETSETYQKLLIAEKEKNNHLQRKLDAANEYMDVIEKENFRLTKTLFEIQEKTHEIKEMFSEDDNKQLNMKNTLRELGELGEMQCEKENIIPQTYDYE